MYRKFWIKFLVNPPPPQKKTTNANGGWFPLTSISRLLGIGSLISAVGGAILDFIYIFLYHTNKTKAHNLNNKAKQKKNTTTHAGTSSTLALHTWSTRVTYRSKTVEPLQKKRAQEDVVTGSVSVEPQLAESNIRKPDGNVTLLFDLRTNVRKVTWAVCGVRRSLL